MSSSPIKENYSKSIEGVLNCTDGTIMVEGYGALDLLETLKDKFDGEFLKITIRIKN